MLRMRLWLTSCLIGLALIPTPERLLNVDVPPASSWQLPFMHLEPSHSTFLWSFVYCTLSILTLSSLFRKSSVCSQAYQYVQLIGACNSRLYRIYASVIRTITSNVICIDCATSKAAGRFHRTRWSFIDTTSLSSCKALLFLPFPIRSKTAAT